MNSNRLYNIFGKKPPLSRKDISDYAESQDHDIRHNVEMKEASDAFDADAMEGWEALGYQTTAMKNLDKKFSTSSHFGWYLSGTLVVVAALVAVFLIKTDAPEQLKSEPQTPTKITQLLEDQEITLEQTDLVLPDSIQQMVDAPKEKQIKVQHIRREFKERQMTPETQLPVEVNVLPTPKIPEVLTGAPEIVRDHKTASEIYLFDLKLVDYTKYRNAPTIKTKQVVLTGTPANMEDEHSSELDPVYRDIDVPYSDYLNKTMSRFSKGNYKSALTRFDVILQTYDTDVNANFYSGLCLYNLGEYKPASDRFLACILSPYSNFDEEAQWMAALSFEKLGENSKAREYFQKIVEQGGYYKKQAQAKLK